MQTEIKAKISAFLVAVAVTLAPSFAMGATSSRSVQVLGGCAPYFRAGKQTVAFEGRKRCAFLVSDNSGRTLDSVTLIVTRRILNKSTFALNTRSSRRYKTVVSDSVNWAHGTFLFNGKGGLARYHLRIDDSEKTTPTPTENEPESPVASPCETIGERFTQETTAIRSCTEDAQCGQVLKRTSCGCTRNWVARKDADATTFYAIIEEARVAGCYDNLALVSSCDCPPADAFACVAGTCTWKFNS